MVEMAEMQALAGEYVLGTLDGHEREQVRLNSQHDTALQQEIDIWEKHFSPLLASIDEVHPSDRLWQKIAARLFDDADTRANILEQRIQRWQSLAIAASIIAFLAMGTVFYQEYKVASVHKTIALLKQSPNAPAFLLSLNARENTLTINMQGPATPPDKSYELWLIIGNKPPKSLGILTAAETTLPFNPSAFPSDALANGTFAISVERKGGSPTGLPTGPVVSTGKLIAL